MKNSSLLLLALLFTFSACNSDDELKDRTQGIFNIDGERFELRCKVDGEDWFPTSTESNPFLGGLPFKVTYSDDGFNINADKKDTDGKLISSIYPSSSNGILNEALKGYVGSRYYSNWEFSGDCLRFDLSNTDDMTLIITDLDESLQRIKATFSYTAYNECGDSVMITEGYLDAPYQD